MPQPPKKKGDAAALHPEASQCAHCAAHGHHGVTLNKCTRCKATFYCSKACQAAHWAQLECRAGGLHATQSIFPTTHPPPPD